MFRQRTSSQKPGDALLATFRQQFPEVGGAAPTSTAPAADSADAARTVTAGAEPAAVASQDSLNQSHEQFRDQDPTPRASHEPWRFTPSLFDPATFAFVNYAGQPPAYYSATPGVTHTMYHSQAGGDLHTPALDLGMGLGTPLSVPTAESTMPCGTTPLDLHAFHHNFQPYEFPPFSPFVQPPSRHSSFAPSSSSSSFVHQDTGYETMDLDSSPMNSDPAEETMGSIDGRFHAQSPTLGLQVRQLGLSLSGPLPESMETFRFHTTLNAPTAMMKHHDEIPLTYLNKGQVYSLAVVDTRAAVSTSPGTRFRTFVRVSFEDEQQRLKPGICWSLWKEGRGRDEAHQRGGKLQAVEYIESDGPPADGDEKRTRLELESSSFDGFSVVWTSGILATTVECNIAVRFNFLSTDFSHSKGVKGIPVRLCAKTSPMPERHGPAGLPPGSRADAEAEICFCKVKLFRDHGAERKLANDVAHVKKTMDKVKQQLAQAESGMKDVGKRKRAGGLPRKGAEGQRPGKIPKHKRTWSMSSASSAGGGGGRLTLEDDLHGKLQTLQDMFTSTRPVSLLCLRGKDVDDPDLHPVSLPGEPRGLSQGDESCDHTAWRSERSSMAESSLVSPSPSSLSLHSQASLGGGAHAPWQDVSRVGPGESLSSRPPDSEQIPARVQHMDDAGDLSGWIEALGVDPSYRPPPPDRASRPVACFYIARRDGPSSAGGALHRAVYLTERTLDDFVAHVADKWCLGASNVVRTIHVLQRGIEVEMDDDVIRELAEGQDMVMEAAEMKPSTSVKREWDRVADGQAADDTTTVSTPGWELRFFF